jgi:SCY1-like protein 1
VSIFTFDKKGNENYLPIAQNALQRLRTLRHPHILRFIDGVDLPTALHIVTEPVMPFKLDDEEWRSQSKKAQIMAITLGLHQVISAVSFLNVECSMVHGNLHAGSILMTKGGDWKLGGFEVISPHGTLSDVFRNHQLLPQKCCPPEMADRQWNVIEKGPATAVDAWCLGCLIFECFNPNFRSADQLMNTDNIPAPIQAEYKRLLHTSVAARLDSKRLLDSRLFSNELVKCITFLDNLVLKTAGEKDLFFKGFVAHVSNLPARMAKYKILPQLTNALEYGGGTPSAFCPFVVCMLCLNVCRKSRNEPADQPARFRTPSSQRASHPASQRASSQPKVVI